MLKKSIAVILAAVMLFSLSVIAFAGSEEDSFGAYEHVFIIGIDGSGAAWGRVDTPNFDRIFADNAYIYNAHTEFITVSAQNWGSILTGVSYLDHGFTNEIADETERGSDSDNNSIFYYVRQAMPDAQLVSFNNWSAINHGIIENDLGVEKINRGDDALVVDTIDRYFEQGNSPALMFVQLDSVDHAGHAYGGQTTQYYNAVKQADVYLGEIYDDLEAAGMLENGLFILVADHGEANGGGHGGRTIEESSAVVAVAGKTVNDTTLPASTRNRDVAAIALYALGVEKPSYMSAEVPSNLFGEERDKVTAPCADSYFIRWLRDLASYFTRAINNLIDIFTNPGKAC